MALSGRNWGPADQPPPGRFGGIKVSASPKSELHYRNATVNAGDVNPVDIAVDSTVLK